MTVIVLATRKGGSGKTTLSLNLAVASERAGVRTTVMDMDQQGSAMTWKDWRGQELRPDVISAAHYNRLPKLIEEARAGGSGLIVLDTPPTSSIVSEAAIRTADLVLVPAVPSGLDLDAAAETVKQARAFGKPTYVVLNAVRLKSPLISVAESFLAEGKVSVCPVRISYRAAHQNPLTSGRVAIEWEPSGQAASEIGEFYRWVLETVAPQRSSKRRRPA